MNECEQIHPQLRGYLAETISARDRRLVARHLNLCASARKELDRLRSGSSRSHAAAAAAQPLSAPAETYADPPSEPWDLRILRWMFKTPKSKEKPQAPEPKKKAAPKVQDQAPEVPAPSGRRSPLVPVLLIGLLFVGLMLLTHLIQNAGSNQVLKSASRWLSKKGFHGLGVGSSMESVLDLTKMDHWDGNGAPVAASFQDMIGDEDHLRVYWSILQPGLPPPQVDFNKNALAVVFLGPRTAAGYSAKFQRIENYTDKTVLWYEEAAPAGNEMASSAGNRPWALQLVPKPGQGPVLIEKIQ